MVTSLLLENGHFYEQARFASATGGKPSGGVAVDRSLGIEGEKSLLKTKKAPMRRIAVLAIANRLGANQAPGDIIERLARECRVNGRAEWYS
jgi:hypothetical protein